MWSHLLGAGPAGLYAIGTGFFQCRSRFRIVLLDKLVRFGVPVMFSSIFITLLHFFDRFLIQRFSSVYDVGLYSMAYKTGMVLNLLVTAFNMGAVPFLSVNADSDASARVIIARMAGIVAFFTLPVFLFISLFIRDIAGISIGPVTLIQSEYHAALYLVPVLLLGYVFYGFFSVFSLVLYYRLKTHIMAWITAAAFIINIVCNLILIPLLDVLGAALATLSAFLIMAVFMYAITQRTMRINYQWRNIFLPGVLAVIPSVFPVLISDQFFWVRTAYFIAFFLLCLMWLRPLFHLRWRRKSE